jgi:AMP deaminase
MANHDIDYEARSRLIEAKTLRQTYQRQLEVSDADETSWTWDAGVVRYSDCPVPRYADFVTDCNRIASTRCSGPCQTLCYQRLRMLEAKFDLYWMVNERQEWEEAHDNTHRDFFNVRKVDTHIHHSAAMTAKHLLRFIKKKLKKNHTDIVVRDSEGPVTLGEVFKKLGVDAKDLSVDP